MMSNVNDEYFNGFYNEIWRSLIPERFSLNEAEYLINRFMLGSHSKVLDLMSGFGRHAIPLAERGIKVTCVDNLPKYIDEIDRKAITKNLPIESILADVKSFNRNNSFDVVICMGNNLNFFPRNELSLVLENVNALLNSGGFFYINTWSISEIAISTFKSEGSILFDNLNYSFQSKFLFYPTRIEYHHTITNSSGEILEEKDAIDYIYSLQELIEIVESKNFSFVDCYSVPGRKEFNLGDHRAYLTFKKL